MGALISKIVNVVKGFGEHAIVKYDVLEDKLVVRSVDGKKFLPQDLYSKWDENDKPKAETDAKQDTDAESAVQPADSVETKIEGTNVKLSPGDNKGKKAALAAK